MSTQAKALALADEINASGQFTILVTLDQAADELRRLHDVNVELLEAAEWCKALCEETGATATNAYAACVAAIANATKEPS